MLGVLKTVQLVAFLRAVAVELAAVRAVREEVIIIPIGQELPHLEGQVVVEHKQAVADTLRSMKVGVLVEAEYFLVLLTVVRAILVVALVVRLALAVVVVAGALREAMAIVLALPFTVAQAAPLRVTLS